MHEIRSSMGRGIDINSERAYNPLRIGKNRVFVGWIGVHTTKIAVPKDIWLRCVYN